MAETRTITFCEPELEDRQKLNPYFQECNEWGCEYSFANFFLWAHHYNAAYALIHDMLVLRSGIGNEVSFAYPMGSGDAKEVIEVLMEDCQQNRVGFRMHGLTEKQVQRLEEMFPGKFIIEADRDSFDYLYRSEDLINLKGKKYHGKRNHINRFKELHPDWSYEPLTRDNMRECMQLAIDWCQENDCDDEGDLAEMCVIGRSFRHFEELGMTGGVIRVEGKVVAFTIGEPINDEVFVVHIEKAYAEVQGAYPMINREFCEHVASAYPYINREEDLGIEGLRKAKLSYRPALLLEKHTAKLTEANN